jgi:hypothetical protein
MFDETRFEVGGSPDQGFCPRCMAFMHPYASTCFACGEERGTGLWSRVQEWTAFQERPIDVLLQDPFLGALAGNTPLLDGQSTDAEVRRRLYIGGRVGDSSEPDWAFTGKFDRFNYLGGIEASPHPEYARMHHSDGVVTWVADRDGNQITSFRLDRLLSLSAYPTVRELVAGRTFGIYGDHLALFSSTKPVVAKGGALRFIFADHDGIWRLAGMGNRTGFTDSVWTFDLVASVAELMGLYTRWWTAIAEAQRGPIEHARDLGFEIDDSAVESAAALPKATASVSDSLRELKQLIDEGLIDPAEYESKRSEILGRI